MLDAPEGPNVDELLQRCTKAEAERDRARSELSRTKQALRAARKELESLNSVAASSVDALNQAVNLINSTRHKLSAIEVHSE